MLYRLAAFLRHSAPARFCRSLARRLRFFWFDWRQANGWYVLLALLPVVIVGLFGWFAWADQQRIAAERQRRVDLECLARNIYHEARGEPLAGQRAVAEVTMNRVASRHYPDSVCAVVYEQRWDRRRGRHVSAFSWTELDWVEEPRGVAWRRAATSAQQVYDDEHTPLVGPALHYHATRIEPYWAKGQQPIVTIGRHVFYE